MIKTGKAENVLVCDQCCHSTDTGNRGEGQHTCADTTDIIKQFVNGFASQSLQLV